MPVALELRVSCSRDGLPRVIGITFSFSFSCIGFFFVPFPACVYAIRLTGVLIEIHRSHLVGQLRRAHIDSSLCSRAHASGVRRCHRDLLSTAQTAPLNATISVDLSGQAERMC